MYRAYKWWLMNVVIYHKMYVFKINTFSIIANKNINENELILQFDGVRQTGIDGSL